MDTELDGLRRELRVFKRVAAGLALLFVGVGLSAVHWLNRRAELTVERINVVDRSGATQLIISNSDRFPLPKIAGQEFPRAVHPAGMLFYDASGSELGGIAITDTEKHGRVAALAFDYRNFDAQGMFTRISPDGESTIAGFAINSRPPTDLDPTAAAKVSKRRIGIHNENESAEILLADVQGRDRIRLRVDANGDARIEILDENGRVTFRAPDSAGTATTAP